MHQVTLHFNLWNCRHPLSELHAVFRCLDVSYVVPPFTSLVHHPSYIFTKILKNELLMVDRGCCASLSNVSNLNTDIKVYISIWIFLLTSKFRHQSAKDIDPDVDIFVSTLNSGRKETPMKIWNLENLLHDFNRTKG